MKSKSLAELLVELDHSTIVGKSTITNISWLQGKELNEFFEESDDHYWSLHKHLGERDTFTFTLYTVGY